jgi:hypothetical protein
MKYRLVSVGVVFCLVSAFLLAQHHPREAAKSSQLRPDDGKLTANVYRNTYFGFSYPLEDGWFANEEMMQANSLKFQRPGTFYLLIADRHTGGPHRERILMIAEDAAEYRPRITVKNFVRKVVYAQAGNPAIEVIHEPYAVDYAGKRFYRSDYRENYSGGSLHKAWVAMEWRGYLLNWVFVADSEKRVTDLVNSLKRLSFVADRK